MGADKTTAGRCLRPTKYVFLFAALLLAGCAANLSYLKDSSLPEKAEIKGLVPFEQKEHLCGPASLSTLLRWAGEQKITPEQLAPLVYTPDKEGTYLFDLAREVRLRGYLAYSPAGGLKDVLGEVGAGRPVLVLENRGLGFYPVYHYSVVGGYDLEAGEILLYEGEQEPRINSLSTFSRTFARAGSTALMALPPGELPLSAPPSAILQTVFDLENAGRRGEARRGYESFAKKFPENWLGRFALGNSLAAEKKFSEAKREFEAARSLAPDRPEILNNLALIAEGEGLYGEAEKLALEAVGKATALGMDASPYKETLEEVRRGIK
jgi:tetratricopeptide (TPR) repeat protein